LVEAVGAEETTVVYVNVFDGVHNVYWGWKLLGDCERNRAFIGDEVRRDAFAALSLIHLYVPYLEDKEGGEATEDAEEHSDDKGSEDESTGGTDYLELFFKHAVDEGVLVTCILGVVVMVLHL
jgi:hypothetical protein